MGLAWPLLVVHMNNWSESPWSTAAISASLSSAVDKPYNSSTSKSTRGKCESAVESVRKTDSSCCKKRAFCINWRHHSYFNTLQGWACSSVCREPPWHGQACAQSLVPHKSGMVKHVCSPSTREVDARGSGIQSSSATQWVPGHLELY